MSEARRLAGEELDQELARLLEVESFPPPEQFREHALLNDPAVYEQAARDPEGWWASQAQELDWSQPFSRVLDDDDLRADLVGRGKRQSDGFSWQACAAGLSALYADAARAR